MRICVMGNALATHTERWARAYAARGHEVHVLSIRTADIPGVTVHPVRVGPANTRNGLLVMLSYVRLLVSARRRLRRLGPDVVHAHYTVTHGVIAARSGFHPVVLSVWGTDAVRPAGDRRRYLGRALNRYALRRADRVTSTSRFMIPIIWRLAGRELAVEQIAFGVDLDAFTPGDRTAGEEITVGFVKHLKRIYGPADLIAALGLLADSLPLRLVMVGDGDQRRSLQRQAAELGVADRVVFTGRVSHQEIPSLMRRFDIFVNPSVEPESFGVSILEASAAGLPVVATTVGGVPEVTVAEETALMVPPGRPDRLADAIRRLAEDPGLRARLGEAGRRFVAARYRWEDGVTQMLEVLASETRP